MADVTYEPVKQALNRIKQLSADEQTRRLAFVRERALRDEVSLLNEAERKGEQKGIQKGIEKGIEKGREENKRETALNLINMNILTDEQIATASGLTVADVLALRTDAKH